MAVAKRFRTISYLKSNADDIAKALAEETGAIVITKNGVPNFVCVSFDEYCRMEETNALVKLVNGGEREINRGGYEKLSAVRSDLDKRFLGNRALPRPKD